MFQHLTLFDGEIISTLTKCRGVGNIHARSTNLVKNLLTISVALFLIVMLSIGCVSETRWGIATRQKKMLQIEPGMSKEEVIKILGTPDLREVVPDDNGVLVDFLIYQTRFAGDALWVPTDQDMTPFAFVDGKLLGWSRNFYDRTIHHEITIKENVEIKSQTSTNTAPTTKDPNK